MNKNSFQSVFRQFVPTLILVLALVPADGLGSGDTLAWSAETASPEVTRRSDGSTVTKYPDGRIETDYPDGRIETDYPPLGQTLTYYPSPDGRYYPAPGSSYSTRYYIDGRIVTQYPDGRTKTETRDGVTRTDHPDGRRETQYTDSSIATEYPDGRVVMRYPEGKTVTEYPDHKIEIQHPDGRIETKLPSNTLLIKDVPHHEHLDLNTPYTGNSLWNTGDVAVEAFVTRPDGSQWTIVLDPGQTINIDETALDHATAVSLHPRGEGNVSAKIKDSSDTTIVDINTTGSYTIPPKKKPCYVIIIVETPFERFVLDKGLLAGRFKPSSVMALAKADTESGMIQNTAGQLKSAADFMGSFNVGMGLPGLAGTGKISMDRMTNLLTSGLKGAGGYGADCFGNVKEAAQGAEAAPDNVPDEKVSKKDKKKGKDEGVSEEQLKAADKNGNPAVSGPIVACGNEDGSKVLKIYSAGGALVDTITQQALKLNPNIILEKMGLAQQWSDTLIQKSGIDFAGYVEKFTGLPLKQIQSTVAQVTQVKAQADQLIGRGASKKQAKKEDPQEPAAVVPNDPLYQAPPKEKKKKLLGILGSSKEAAPIILGSGMRIGGAVLGAGSGESPKGLEIEDQYALHRIGFLPLSDLNSAWNVVDADQKNIVVAVVDSGLDMTHPDGPQYIWKNPKEIPGNGKDDDNDGFVDDIQGWNFLDENHDFTDIRGHGTFVAGIIAAKYNNGIGIAGINPGAVIMPVKVADEEGQTDSLAIYRGINYAVDHGAKVINVSLGGRTISKLEQQAVERAHALGVLVVIAAGNNNDNLVSFGPSSSKHGLAVGQVDYSGVRSTVSNWGPNLGLVAPGEQIYSLCSKDNKHVLPSIRKEGYYKQDGTSFSTPMVAATASLILAKNPALTNQQVADILLATATDMGEPGWDGMTGAGLLNAAAALRSDATGQLTVMFTNLRVNRDQRDKVVSVDVYGTVRGRFEEYTVEAGKGKNAARFETIAGPYSEPVDYGHISRLSVQESLRGSDDWILRIKAIDENGQERIASTPFTLPK